MNSLKSNRAAKWFEQHPRLGGLLLLVPSWSISIWYAHTILTKAEEGKPNVSISYTFAALVAIGFLGFCLLLGGNKVYLILKKLEIKPRTARHYAIAIIFVLPGFIAYFWLHYKLTLLGYG